MSACDENCLHPSRRSSANNCPDCGRLSAHSWVTSWIAGPDGSWQAWGGTCKKHGEWREESA